MKTILAFSGGKDSTACALGLAERGEPFELFFTPTGRELSECIEHIHHVQQLTGMPLVMRTAKLDLDGLIKYKDCLPNQNMRWCTQVLKIEPAKAYLLQNYPSTLLVGLRADEPLREGMWGDYATYRYPLREWGWGIDQVLGYLDSRGVTVPERTDCDYCYDQRLYEWWRLWKNYPERFAHAELLEARTGHTFRSATRDTWPAALCDLRARFEKGDFPSRSLKLAENKQTKCRVCSL